MRGIEKHERPWADLNKGRGRHDFSYAFGGSQSTQAPMAAVTAFVLLPIQGEMTHESAGGPASSYH